MSRDAPPGFPSVSVVLPVRNAEGDIERAVLALAALDYPADRLERIVVDNGSTDRTPEIVARHPVTLLREDAIEGSYAARNRGWRGASGDWIAFTDADCAPEPDWLRRLLAPPVPQSVGAIAGEVVALEESTPVQRLTERYGIMKHAVTLPHKKLPCFSTANVAIRRGLLDRLDGFRQDVRFFGDMEISWRMQLRERAEILFRPDARVRHRHRRTWRALWRQGVQHGRGVAFMKRTYPEHYAISPREQLSRLAGIAGAARGGGGHDPDRRFAPLFLSLWYGGLLAGYLLGPAYLENPR